MSEIDFMFVFHFEISFSNPDQCAKFYADLGANYLDVSSIGVSHALIADDDDLLTEAVNGHFNECQLTTGSADGIKVDGSFMQHSNQLYTGNYGQVFMRNMLKIFIETSDTTIVPPESVQSAFLTLIGGSEWFMYLKDGGQEDPLSPILSWQYSAIGRMVSHKYEDWHGTGLSLNDILEGTKDWANHAEFQAIVDRLRNQGSVNPGGLLGTRFFHTSDYLVHRSQNYIVTLKMFSSRTSNSECNNGQNPYGFHLSDGAIYTYLDGNEYTNVYGAWDWNLVPGTTVDHEATRLACNAVQFKGLESFVGGAAVDNYGVAVMNYTNPSTRSLNWLKTFFFFPNAYVVQFVGVPATSTLVPVFTTLDQRQLSGPVYINGELQSDNIMVSRMASTLWHDRVGYEFAYPVELTVETVSQAANWSEIGISTGIDPESLFAAYFAHPPGSGDDERFTYITHLDIELEDFLATTSGKKSAKNGQNKNRFEVLGNKAVEKSSRAPALVRGISYGYEQVNGDRVISLVFLTPGEYATTLEDIVQVDSNSPILLIFERKDNNWTLAVSDPTQTLTTVRITVSTANAQAPYNFEIALPTGSFAGSTFVMDLGI